MLVSFMGMLYIWTGYHLGGFEPSLIVATAAMSLSSFVLGWKFGGSLRSRPGGDHKILEIIVKIMGIFLLSWLAFLAALVIADLTPLCIGRGNGDGDNSLQDCIRLSVIWPVFVSVLMALPFAVSAGIVGFLLKELFRTTGELGG